MSPFSSPGGALLPRGKWLGHRTPAQGPSRDHPGWPPAWGEVHWGPQTLLWDERVLSSRQTRETMAPPWVPDDHHLGEARGRGDMSRASASVHHGMGSPCQQGQMASPPPWSVCTCVSACVQCACVCTCVRVCPCMCRRASCPTGSPDPGRPWPHLLTVSPRAAPLLGPSPPLLRTLGPALSPVSPPGRGASACGSRRTNGQGHPETDNDPQGCWAQRMSCAHPARETRADFLEEVTP